MEDIKSSEKNNILQIISSITSAVVEEMESYLKNNQQFPNTLSAVEKLLQEAEKYIPENKFLKKLSEGPIICAEGYIFELERRCYIQAGSFVPECVLDYPNTVEELHRNFVHSGSDVVVALTYYAHREKMNIIGQNDKVELLNRRALEIAKKVAVDTGTLLAGDICNTNIWTSGGENDEALVNKVRDIFMEQVQWAHEAGCDYVIAETFGYLAEAKIALDIIKSFNLPAVVTLSIHKSEKTLDGYSVEEAMLELEKNGATVVGLNCHRGPATMLPLLERIVKVVKIPVAALPVTYRTCELEPTFMSLTNENLPSCTVNNRPFPVALDNFMLNRFEIIEFTKRAMELGIKYVGLCCGAIPCHIRAMAETMGRKPPGSKYSPDMSNHFAYGTNPSLVPEYKDNKNDL